MVPRSRNRSTKPSEPRLTQLGWKSGRNITLEARFGNGQRDRVVELAEELVRLPVDVLLGAGTASVQAARAATATIPVVMTGIASDPVGLGLLQSLARPGGNVTGVSGRDPVLSAKRVELLAELVPGIGRVAVIVTATNPSKPQNIGDSKSAGDRLGIQLRTIDVDVSDLPAAFAAARDWQAEALLIIGDAGLQGYVPTIANWATRCECQPSTTSGAGLQRAA